MNLKKKGTAFFGTAVAAMAFTAVAAFACTNLASSTSAPPAVASVTRSQ
jgi:hypothetical protein